MGLGPSPSYLAKFNSYVLPGYVQQEDMDNTTNIADHYGAYADGSLSEDTGLSNKIITLDLKVWEQDYLTCKDQVQQAATIVRSKRDGFAPLYIQYPDKHYEALTRSIKISKQAGTSVRTLNYIVEFECKPWLYNDTTHTLTGTGTVTTDSVGRTIDNGTWTPTIMTLTGTNITVSGYTATGDFAGFVSVSGAVTNLILDTEAYTATIGGVNRNDLLYSIDYRTYVGPGKTTFVTTGASSCSITYTDRWPI